LIENIVSSFLESFDVPWRTSFTRLTPLGQPAMLAAEMGDSVLVVESNSTARAKVTQALHQAGYQTLVAAHLAQALSMARAPIVAVVIGERLATPEVMAAFSVPIVIMGRELDAAGVAAAVRTATARPAAPGWAPAPVSTPSLAVGEAATRLTPKATPEQRKVIAALREELAFFREATYFRVLEIETDASEEHISDAFQRFSNRWHPDRLSADASQEMRAIAGEIYLVGKAAYDVLSNPRKRRMYEPKSDAETEKRAVKRQSVLRRILGKE
jgi:CheY-like chemotaxis protein